MHHSWSPSTAQDACISASRLLAPVGAPLTLFRLISAPLCEACDYRARFYSTSLHSYAPYIRTITKLSIYSNTHFFSPHTLRSLHSKNIQLVSFIQPHTLSFISIVTIGIKNAPYNSIFTPKFKLLALNIIYIVLNFFSSSPTLFFTISLGPPSTSKKNTWRQGFIDI